jgi:hypothetical protein
MSLWKVAVILLALVCGYLVYVVFDQSVTTTYMAEGSKQSKAQRDLLKAFVNEGGASLSRENVIAILKRNKAEYFEVGGGLSASGVVFEFKDGKLSNVKCD